MYVEGASSRCLNVPPRCTNADDLLCCAATVGNLGYCLERHWMVMVLATCLVYKWSWVWFLASCKNLFLAVQTRALSGGPMCFILSLVHTNNPHFLPTCRSRMSDSPRALVIPYCGIIHVYNGNTGLSALVHSEGGNEPLMKWLRLSTCMWALLVDITIAIYI